MKKQEGMPLVPKEKVFLDVMRMLSLLPDELVLFCVLLQVLCLLYCLFAPCFTEVISTLLEVISEGLMKG